MFLIDTPDEGTRLGMVRKSSEAKVTQSCQTLCDPMGYIVHGILQARILEWVAFPCSRGSSQPRDWTQVSRTAEVSHSFQLNHQGIPRILEWVAYPFSSGSSWPRNRTRVSCTASGFFTNWAIREAPGVLYGQVFNNRLKLLNTISFSDFFLSFLFYLNEIASHLPFWKLSGGFYFIFLFYLLWN